MKSAGKFMSYDSQWRKEKVKGEFQKEKTEKFKLIIFRLTSSFAMFIWSLCVQHFQLAHIISEMSPLPHTTRLSLLRPWVLPLGARTAYKGKSFSLWNQLSAAEELKSRHKPTRRHAFSVKIMTDNKNSVLRSIQKRNQTRCNSCTRKSVANF